MKRVFVCLQYLNHQSIERWWILAGGRDSKSTSLRVMGSPNPENVVFSDVCRKGRSSFTWGVGNDGRWGTKQLLGSPPFQPLKAPAWGINEKMLSSNMWKNCVVNYYTSYIYMPYASWQTFLIRIPKNLNYIRAFSGLIPLLFSLPFFSGCLLPARYAIWPRIHFLKFAPFGDPPQMHGGHSSKSSRRVGWKPTPRENSGWFLLSKKEQTKTKVKQVTVHETKEAGTWKMTISFWNGPLF